MKQKYLGYAAFGAIVALVVGLAVSHSLHMRALVNAMAGPDPKAAAAAAAELIKQEQFADSITGEPLSTRLRVINALVALGTPEAVTQLDAMLKDQDKPVRDRAQDALVELAARSDKNLDNLVAGIKEGDANQRNGSVRALQRLGLKDPQEALRIIPKVCEIMKKEAGARSSAGDVLGSFKAQSDVSVKTLIPYLKDPDEGVRAAACDALGKVGNPAAIPYLLPMLDNTPTVHRVAVGAIALIADKSGEQALIQALQNPNEDNEARAQAATGLGKIATPEAITALIKALTDYDLKVELAAVSGLARAGMPAVPALLAALKQPDTRLRLRAAQALASIQTQKADAGLVALLHDRHAEVRVQAALALGFPGNEPAVKPLIALLRDPNGDVAEAASTALAAIGAPARPALIAALAGPDTQAYFAARALARQGQDTVEDIERAAQRSPNAQRWAIVALGSMGGPQAADALQRFAASPNPQIRNSAEEALKRIAALSRSQ
ncbi:MAG: HEAT repeat domain-containing protein [Chthonomonadales bacterium]